MDNAVSKTRKKKRPLRFIIMFLLVIIAIILAAELSYFIIRIQPGSVIPDEFDVYAGARSPLTFADHVLSHESLPSLLSNPALASAAPALNGLKRSGLIRHPLLRFVLRGAFSAALLKDGSFIAAWDSAFAAPVLPLLPLISARLDIEGLSFVRGAYRRLEYRTGGAVYYIAARRNLLIVSGSEQLLAAALGDDGASYSPGKSLRMKEKNIDLSVLLSSKTVTGSLSEGNPLLAAAFRETDFPDLVELALEIKPAMLNVRLSAEVSTDNAAFKAILEKNSPAPSLMDLAPAGVQYLTGLSAASFEEALAAAAVVNPELPAALEAANKTSRALFRLGVDDLLYSWTGAEFGVMGLEERAAPVFAIKIRDEQMRRRVFDTAFDTMFLRENTLTVLDGSRIPQIQIPPFIGAVLRILKVEIPSPYYTVYEGWLLVSESPENILTVVEGARKKTLLAKTDVWRSLAEAAGDSAALTLFYSLDRSLPFFLRGQGPAAQILRMYRRGLFRVSFKDGVFTMNLSAQPGAGRGLESVPGYPLDLGAGNQGTGSEVYLARTASGGEARLLLTRGNTALAVNPADHKIYELASDHPVWVIPAAGLNPKTMKESAAWVVSERGLVTLVNGNMEAAEGFPLITGLKISSVPASYGGKVYLASEEPEEKGAFYTVDVSGKIASLGGDYGAPVLSPPSFLELKQGNRIRVLMSFYPKSFLGEIILADDSLVHRGGWPVFASGIAYGSPLLLAPPPAGANIAFVTMAGELSLYSETGAMIQGFPVSLEGVFYLQPCWDGEFLWLVSESGRLYRVSLYGGVLEQQIPDLRVREEGFIGAADADGDGVPEIFLSGEGNALYAYSRGLNLLEGFPLPVWGRPVIADLDGDGRIDLAGVGMDNKLYRWKFKQEETKHDQ
ncbi:MAG: VCBS repeat-containing protein [Treponema sp.]|jgi:hypothetical protein|nr:VCBS repeat-containing protein [Treponema sp.]